MKSTFLHHKFDRDDPIFHPLTTRKKFLSSPAAAPSAPSSSSSPPASTQKPTVLVAEKLGEAGLKLLKEFANVDCSYNLIPEELCTKISLYDALIVRNGTKVTREVFQSSAGRLKVVGRAGVEIDNVDLASATEHGCLVVNAPTANTVAVAEHGIALLVAMARNVAQANTSVKAGKKAFRRSRTVAALSGDSIDCFDSSGKSEPQPTLCDELILPAGYPCSEYMGVDQISYSDDREPRNSGPTIIEKICATIESLLDYHYTAIWDREKVLIILRRILKNLVDVQKLHEEDFLFKKQLHECFGPALVAMGPERLLPFIPLNLEVEDLLDANIWLFPFLNHLRSKRFHQGMKILLHTLCGLCCHHFATLLVIGSS
ncbi:D-3-phosphoglycerate dehydrogenase 3 [Arachis hypogaea]|nr:D-3-phosphoglycerate dehydrogenase 3 [Arachis hypogaea]